MKEKRINFTILGSPFGKLNMQPRMIGNHPTMFQPTKNADYMSRVLLAFQEQCHPTDLIESRDAMLYLELIAYFEIPKSTPKYKIPLMENGTIRPTKKCDCDNISKIVCDAMSKFVFHDDAQIVSLKVDKYYTSSHPRVDVRIRSVELEKGIDL